MREGLFALWPYAYMLPLMSDSQTYCPKQVAKLGFGTYAGAFGLVK